MRRRWVKAARKGMRGRLVRLVIALFALFMPMVLMAPPAGAATRFPLPSASGLRSTIDSAWAFLTGYTSPSPRTPVQQGGTAAGRRMRSVRRPPARIGGRGMPPGGRRATPGLPGAAAEGAQGTERARGYRVQCPDQHRHHEHAAVAARPDLRGDRLHRRVYPDNTYTNNATLHPEYFNGSIADVAYFNRALTLQDVSTIYGAGKTAASLLSKITQPLGGQSRGRHLRPEHDPRAAGHRRERRHLEAGRAHDVGIQRRVPGLRPGREPAGLLAARRQRRGGHCRQRGERRDRHL